MHILKKNKEKLQKEAHERYKNLLEEEKMKSEKRLVKMSKFY